MPARAKNWHVKQKDSALLISNSTTSEHLLWLFVHPLIAECLSVRLIIVQVQQALVESYLVWSCTCMSVHNRFTIEICGFMHSLRTFVAHATHDAIRMEVENSEDRKWCQNKSREMKDSKIMVTEDNLHVSTRAICFACWPMNGIGGGQHDISTTFHPSPFRPIKLSMSLAWDT